MGECSIFKWIMVLLSLISASTGSKSGKKTLVLLENLSIKETHSVFFSDLISRDYQLVFKLADDSYLNIYDHLIIFAPLVEEFGGSVDMMALTDFVDHGGNILVAASSKVGDILRDSLWRLGLNLMNEKQRVIDHLNYDINDWGDHALLVVDPSNLISAPLIVCKNTNTPILYQGLGLVADPDNPLVLEIMTGYTTSYLYSPTRSIKHYPHAVGKRTLLVAGLQARNNACVVFSGSTDLFSNEFFASPVQKSQVDSKEYQQNGNRALSKALTQWVLKEIGILKIGEVKQPSSEPPAAYTVMDDVYYYIEIQELVEGKWVAFTTSDVQLEFFRIDPFVCTFLNKTSDGKAYYATFKLPDVY